MNNNIDVVDTRRIVLKGGGVLEVNLSQAFLDKMRNHFDIPKTEHITDDQIKTFLLGNVMSAVSKVDQHGNE